MTQLHLATVFISESQGQARSPRQGPAWFLWCFIDFDIDLRAKTYKSLLLIFSA